MVAIKSFYSASNIFITGGTGFLGKVLVEKLIRSCPEIETIHLLIRPKKGLTPAQRLLAIQNDQIFNRIRSECPSALSKLKLISGDVCSPRLGLSPVDEETLLDEVSIAFHAAASVRFDSGMKDAVEQNTLGTLKVMDLFSRMKNLKSAVHVSTAYCNPGPPVAEEKVYDTCDKISKSSFLTLAQTVPAPIFNGVGEQLMGDHSNTYTFSKSMGEQVVSDYQKSFPLCIVRPSIVTSSISEPYPGWIDSYDGVTNIVLSTGTGKLRTMMCNEDEVVDLIPVDTVTNTIIAAAWANERSYDKEKPIHVINCTSGEMNPIRWGEQKDLTLKYSRETPFTSVQGYPSVSYRTDRTMNNIMRMWHHTLPAALADSISLVKGDKPKMMRVVKGIHNFMNRAEWVTFDHWRFKSDNYRKLIEEVRRAEDGAEFSCDIKKLNWTEYMRDYILGIKKYLLREGDSSIKDAKLKLQRFYWTKMAVNFGLTGSGSYLIYNVLV